MNSGPFSFLSSRRSFHCRLTPTSGLNPRIKSVTLDSSSTTIIDDPTSTFASEEESPTKIGARVRSEERTIWSTSTDLVVHRSSGVVGAILATSSSLRSLVPVTVDERGRKQKENDNRGCLGCLVCHKTMGENGRGYCSWLAGNH
ncbi:unnamed protein product [Lactuca saligna]|uniref:Uncharacterized protein n=1 Tax=Lactuca saligna TaxID=75948 RepID=A0AA36E2G8_LACSI|nr:unnamed protein product [Lactuca saligna]